MNFFLENFLLVFLVMYGSACNQPRQKSVDYPIQPVPAGNVMLSDTFWKTKMDINRRVTVPFGFEMCENTGRIDNFRIAGDLKDGDFKSVYPFDDSDVYKIIEGASYVLQQEYDKDLDTFLDSLIQYIGMAQEEDGYLQTWRTIDSDNPGGDWWAARKDGQISGMAMNCTMSDIFMRLRLPIMQQPAKNRCSISPSKMLI